LNKTTYEPRLYARYDLTLSGKFQDLVELAMLLEVLMIFMEVIFY
jgi:hypothetical protein